MFYFSQGTAHHQSAAAGNLFAVDGHIHFVSCDEVRRDRELVFPMFDPVLRIAPMALGGVRDFGQHVGFIRLCSTNLNVHAHRSLTLSWSDNRVLIRPLPGGEGTPDRQVNILPSSLRCRMLSPKNSSEIWNA